MKKKIINLSIQVGNYTVQATQFYYEQWGRGRYYYSIADGDTVLDVGTGNRCRILDTEALEKWFTDWADFGQQAEYEILKAAQ